MGGLGRRVDVLESITEEARVAPYRRLVSEYGVPLPELLATADEVRDFVECLRGRGFAWDEILVRCADHWGLPLDELRRNCEDAARRYA